MNDQILEMLDHTNIRQVLERYCRGVGRMDKELLDGVYWPEATDDHGLYVGLGREFADFLFPYFTQYKATMHLIGQSNIEVKGNTAVAETYYIAGHRSEQEGKVTFLTAWGRYIDKLEKRGNEWRIADRVCVLEHIAEDSNIVNGPMAIDLFKLAHRDRNDLSYIGRG
jgi:hypothetical protein